MESQVFSALQERVMNDAMRRLDAIGAKYAVVAPNGKTFGTLEVKPVSTRQHVHKWGHYNIPERLKAAKTGDVLTFVVEGEADKDFGVKLQGAVTGHASKLLGSGAYTTMFNRRLNQVELLVL